MRQQLQNTTRAILSASHYHGLQRVFYECTDQEAHMRCNQCLKATARPDNVCKQLTENSAQVPNDPFNHVTILQNLETHNAK